MVAVLIRSLYVSRASAVTDDLRLTKTEMVRVALRSEVYKETYRFASMRAILKVDLYWPSICLKSSMSTPM